MFLNKATTFNSQPVGRIYDPNFFIRHCNYNVVPFNSDIQMAADNQSLTYTFIDNSGAPQQFTVPAINSYPSIANNTVFSMDAFNAATNATVPMMPLQPFQIFVNGTNGPIEQSPSPQTMVQNSYGFVSQSTTPMTMLPTSTVNGTQVQANNFVQQQGAAQQFPSQPQQFLPQQTFIPTAIPQNCLVLPPAPTGYLGIQGQTFANSNPTEIIHDNSWTSNSVPPVNSQASFNLDFQEQNNMCSNAATQAKVCPAPGFTESHRQQNIQNEAIISFDDNSCVPMDVEVAESMKEDDPQESNDWHCLVQDGQYEIWAQDDMIIYNCENQPVPIRNLESHDYSTNNVINGFLEGQECIDAFSFEPKFWIKGDGANSWHYFGRDETGQYYIFCRDFQTKIEGVDKPVPNRKLQARDSYNNVVADGTMQGQECIDRFSSKISFWTDSSSKKNNIHNVYVAITTAYKMRFRQTQNSVKGRCTLRVNFRSSYMIALCLELLEEFDDLFGIVAIHAAKKKKNPKQYKSIDAYILFQSEDDVDKAIKYTLEKFACLPPHSQKPYWGMNENHAQRAEPRSAETIAKDIARKTEAFDKKFAELTCLASDYTNSNGESFLAAKRDVVGEKAMLIEFVHEDRLPSIPNIFWGLNKNFSVDKCCFNIVEKKNDPEYKNLIMYVKFFSAKAPEKAIEFVSQIDPKIKKYVKSFDSMQNDPARGVQSIESNSSSRSSSQDSGSVEPFDMNNSNNNAVICYNNDNKSPAHLVVPGYKPTAAAPEEASAAQSPTYHVSPNVFVNLMENEI